MPHVRPLHTRAAKDRYIYICAAQSCNRCGTRERAFTYSVLYSSAHTCAYTRAAAAAVNRKAPRATITKGRARSLFRARWPSLSARAKLRLFTWSFFFFFNLGIWVLIRYGGGERLTDGNVCYVCIMSDLTVDWWNILWWRLLVWSWMIYAVSLKYELHTRCYCVSAVLSKTAHSRKL